MIEIADSKENGVRSKADLFLAVSQRNALRRASGLPLLDMRAEMQAEHHRDLVRAYDTACRQHWSVYEQMKLDVLAEFRRQMPGYGASAGGRWAIAAIAEQRFRSFLEVKGHVRPPDPNLVRYGEDRT
jgi:hypothetical protein